MSEKKTNAMRILETEGIDFEIKHYDFDEENLDAKHAAISVGLPLEQVFKTIVMENEKKEIFVFCVPASSTVNLKKARNLTNSKDISPIKQNQLLATTGYIRGGCSPLGMKKHFTTFIDETAVLFDKIAISAGLRGVQILVNGEILAKLISAKLEELTL